MSSNCVVPQALLIHQWAMVKWRVPYTSSTTSGISFGSSPRQTHPQPLYTGAAIPTEAAWVADDPVDHDHGSSTDVDTCSKHTKLQDSQVLATCITTEKDPEIILSNLNKNTPHLNLCAPEMNSATPNKDSEDRSPWMQISCVKLDLVLH